MNAWLLGARHELKNRYFHVEYENEDVNQSAKTNDSKCQNDTFDGTLGVVETEYKPRYMRKGIAYGK